LASAGWSQLRPGAYRSQCMRNARPPPSHATPQHCALPQASTALCPGPCALSLGPSLPWEARRIQTSSGIQTFASKPSPGDGGGDAEGPAASLRAGEGGGESGGVGEAGRRTGDGGSAEHASVCGAEGGTRASEGDANGGGDEASEDGPCDGGLSTLSFEELAPPEPESGAGLPAPPKKGAQSSSRSACLSALPPAGCARIAVPDDVRSMTGAPSAQQQVAASPGSAHPVGSSPKFSSQPPPPPLMQSTPPRSMTSEGGSEGGGNGTSPTSECSSGRDVRPIDASPWLNTRLSRERASCAEQWP
jgi:hypothetical protein